MSDLDGLKAKIAALPVFTLWGQSLLSREAVLAALCQPAAPQPSPEVEAVMDECAKYINTQYGISALYNPIDRGRILAALTRGSVDK